MTGNQITDLYIAYKSFIEAYDCSKLNIFSNIYKTIYALAFGGCGLDVENEIEKLASLNASNLTRLGINDVVHCFLLIGIHKSIIYGKMRYTNVLIQLAKEVATAPIQIYEEFIDFYEKIYELLHTSLVNNDEKEYIQAITQLSRELRKCSKSTITWYKCKVLATLGDLRKYDRVRKYWYGDDSYLFQAIDYDLEYIAKKLKFEVELYGKLNRVLYELITGFKVPSGLVTSLSYLISTTYFDLSSIVTSAIIITSFSTSGMLFDNLAKKYLEKTDKKNYKIIPTILYLDEKSN